MNRSANKRRLRIIVIALLSVVLVVWAVWGNTALTVNETVITDSAFPQSLSGLRIAHISDLHNAQFGENNNKLLALLKETRPDIIAITGDLISSYNHNNEVGVDFVKEAVKIAPTYFVSGNHESRIAEYAGVKEEIEAAGAVILDNNSVFPEELSGKIRLIGLEGSDIKEKDRLSEIASEQLGRLDTDDGVYTILLAHRPELFKAYVQSGVELVLSGHMHGGQIRLPFIGGIATLTQGLSERYDSGLYTEQGTNMIISRGLGNSAFPLRINNRPEIVVVELHSLQSDGSQGE